ncbi:TraE family protein, partial [Anaerovorax odorimutans]|nr:TraE family protein [Anaerovorax odorimutans]
TYFSRVTTELTSHFARLGSKLRELDAAEKLRVLHDFYRAGQETEFRFDLVDSMRKGHCFQDAICPDSFEFERGTFRMGERYGRVLFLRD